MSAKVPVAVRLAKQALADNKCVVIGLQSTGEARTEEAVTKYVCPLFHNSFMFIYIQPSFSIWSAIFCCEL